MPEILIQLFGLATIASALRAFVPLYLATLGGVFNERSGVVNIGICLLYTSPSPRDCS